MNGYKKDEKLTLEVGLEAAPLVVTINAVKHTEQGPTILDVSSQPSPGAQLVPASFKMKVFDRRYAHELRKKLQTGTWNPDKDHLLLRDAMTGSVDTFLTEWCRDAKIPYSPTSIEAPNREAIIWEYMRRQYKSELAMHQVLKLKGKKTDPELIETATLRTGTTNDFVLGLMYTSNQYFNVSCLLVREVEGAKPFSSYPTLLHEQDFHLGLSVFNEAGCGPRVEIPEIILTLPDDDDASDSEKTITDGKTISGEETTSDDVGKPNSEPSAEKGKGKIKYLLSPNAPLPMESREITVGTSETFP
ncbi:unnamed protein product [Clonostachys byssicola]|uniref:Uncharacterized protein n=1 Tax=Clonostachys byssicola TaxID=160290 RepID=A0A9N9UCR3_9HYPO|nr:unnamed protein product [Clonostachys byssicola]